MTIVEETSDSGTMSVLGRLLFELDPRVLLDNPLNPRTELGDVSAEAASMRECGVLEPLIVVPAPGNKFMILRGHRRRVAAIEAGLATVPCDVRPEYVDLPPEQLADMLAENLHRQDLSALDEAGGYAQLAMFDGWNPERIAKRLGRTVDRVRAGIAASEIRPELRPQVVEGAVTLEQAAAIEEFAGEEKAYGRLVRAAQYPPGLHHALADERHRRTVEQRKETTRVGLRDANVRIIAKPSNFRYGSVELGIDELTDLRGIPLTVEGHASCPGNAAFVGAEGEPVFVCQHPKEWGHDVPGHYRHQSKVEIQAQEEAAQADREYQTALKVADDARASFLTEYLTRKGPPTGRHPADGADDPVPVQHRRRTAGRRGAAAAPRRTGCAPA